MALKFNKLRSQEGSILLSMLLWVAVIILIFFVAIPLLLAAVGASHVLSKEVDKNYSGFATIPDTGWIGGVCAGFAYYTKTPTWAWRTGTVVVTVFSDGLAIVPYVAIWFLAPHMDGVPDDYGAVCK